MKPINIALFGFVFCSSCRIGKGRRRQSGRAGSRRTFEF